jgi:hypothetical protein
MTAWALLIVSAGLLLILRKRSKPKFLWVVKVALALIAGASFAAVSLGGWVADRIRTVAGWIGNLGDLNMTSGQVAAVAVLLLVIATVLDVVVDRKADKVAIAAMVLLPLLFIVASGPVADGGSQLMAAIREAGAAGLGPMIGS